MSRRRAYRHQSGFTIVELMIATTVFGLILMVITAGVIHFTADYYKGINTSATQNVARTIAGIVTQNLQYGGGKGGFTGVSSGVDKSYCIGNTIIDYNHGVQLSASGGYGVFVTTKLPNDGNTCPIYTDLRDSQKDSGQELLGQNMRLTQLDISGSGQYKVDVTVAYGDIDLLCATARNGNPGGCNRSDPALQLNVLRASGSTITCKSTAGAQFCAASHLSTEVVSRFGGAGS